MITQTKACIYLAEQRQQSIGLGYSCSQHVLQSAIDEILVYDVVLKETAPFFKPAFENTLSIVLPLSNQVWIDIDESASVKIELHEAGMLVIHEGEAIHICNANLNAHAEFILMQMPMTEIAEFRRVKLFETNELQKIVSSPGCEVFVGKFSGRREGSLTVDTGCVHVFVLEGAFEFQNRLLQPRDALTLTGVDHIEFEALSNEAKLMIVCC